MEEAILSIDPALEYTGYTVWRNNKVIQSNFIRTTKKKATPTESARITYTSKRLIDIIEDFNVKAIIIEAQYVGRNRKTAMCLSRVRGALQLLAGLHDIPIYTYEPSEIKEITSENGGTDKDGMYAAIEKLIDEGIIEIDNLVWEYIQALIKDNVKTDDIIDSICIGYCYIKKPEIAKLA